MRRRVTTGWGLGAWFLTAVLGACFIASLLARHRAGATYFGLFGLLALLVCVLRRDGGPLLRGPPRALLVLGIFVNGMGWGGGLMDRIAFYDQGAHLLTTAGLVAVLPALMPRTREVLRDHPAILTLLLVGVGALTGICWEVYEFLVDRFLSPPPSMDISDTIADLVADVLGAFAGALLAAKTARATSPPAGSTRRWWRAPAGGSRA